MQLVPQCFFVLVALELGRHRGADRQDILVVKLLALEFGTF